jgi:exodeoxyribonuclease VII large subunit
MPSLFDPPFEEPAPDAAGRAAEDHPSRTPRRPPLDVRRRVLTVSQLTARVRTCLEEAFFEVWVEGELSNCRVWNTGHMYFTLKDAQAQVRGVMFRSALRLVRFAPRDGLRVVARGRVTVYEPKGEYQLVCEHLEPEGLGALQLAFDQLKERLAAEGLFDASRKRPLPALPRKVGVVTSLDGAAVRDIVQVLRRRYANVHVVIRRARVQGEGAALDIARGLRAVATVPGVDVVIVGRGGGSLEDLWAFNEEVVARAIAGCPVPVIAGVGHETDVTIADFVADLRAPTPSAAAEMVLARKEDVQARIDRLARRMRSAVAGRVHRHESRLRALEARPGFAGLHGRLTLRGRHAAELAHRLRHALLGQAAARRRALRALEQRLEILDLRHRLGAVRTRLVAGEARMVTAFDRRRHACAIRLRSAAARLESLSPLGVLARGYAVCWDAARRRVIRDSADTRTGDQVRVTLGRGELTCDVTRIDD